MDYPVLSQVHRTWLLHEPCLFWIFNIVIHKGIPCCSTKMSMWPCSIIPLVPFVCNRALIALWRSITCFEGRLHCHLLLIRIASEAQRSLLGMTWSCIIHYSYTSDRRTINGNRQMCVLIFSAEKERWGDESCVEEGSILLQLIWSRLPSILLKKVNSEFNGCKSVATVRLNTSTEFRPSFTPPSTTGADSTRPTWVDFSYKHAFGWTVGSAGIHSSEFRMVMQNDHFLMFVRLVILDVCQACCIC